MEHSMRDEALIIRNISTLLYFIFNSFPDSFWMESTITALNGMHSCKLNLRVNIIMKEDMKVHVASP